MKTASRSVKFWRWIASHLSQPRVIYDRVGRTPYLSRYYLTARPRMPDGSDPFTKEGNVRPGTLERERFCSVFLHRFHRGDDDLALHNHPWRWAISFVLAGGYLEERRTENGGVERRTVRPWSINIIRDTTYHRVELLDSECYSLFLAGPRASSWSFWERDTGRTVPWRQFIDELRNKEKKFARDLNGKKIQVGSYVFVDRDRESFRVVSIEPMASRSDAFWIRVDDPKQPAVYFDISVKVDEARS